MSARVLVLTPDLDSPVGGIKIHYQVVDALNRLGIEAMIVHRKRGFRCTWFGNATRVVYLDDVRIDAHDVVVVPEEWTGFIPELPASVPKIVFHQNAYSNFSWGADWQVLRRTFERPDVARLVVVSEDNACYLRYVYPNTDVKRIRYTIDASLFKPPENGQKSRQVAFMPRRRERESRDVLSMLYSRGVLEGWTVVPLHGMPEHEVARHLQDSAIFLSFSEREGLPLPPAEAMACGCVVIGFHGFGGRDFGDNAIWVADGDVVAMAQAAESALVKWSLDNNEFQALTDRASRHIHGTYSAANTEHDVALAFGCSVEGVPAGDPHRIPDSMWHSRKLGQRVLGRVERAARALLKG